MIATIVVLCYIGLSQALFASFIVYTHPQRQTHDRVLIVWLMSIALRFWLVATANTHPDFFDADFSAALIPLTFGPFLYLYTFYLLRGRRRFAPVHIFHFVPFFLFTTYYFLVVKDSSATRVSFFNYFLTFAFIVSASAYTAWVFMLLRTFRKNIKREMYSYDNASNRLFWLNYVTILFVITFFIYFLVKLVAYDSNVEIVTALGLTWLAFSVSYFAIRQPALYKEATLDTGLTLTEKMSDTLNRIDAPAKVVTQEKTPQHETPHEPKEQALNELTDEKRQQIERLLRFMKEEKPYLNPELTLPELASRVNIQKHQVTHLLNVFIGKNFFEFVNEYRLEEVKRRLNEPRYEHLTLVAIAYDCGFNSKSTFNSFFKEYTGQTPSEFRKENKKDPKDNIQPNS